MYICWGEEVICVEGSYIYEWELGMMVVFFGVVLCFVFVLLGVLSFEDVWLVVCCSVY